MSFYDQSKRNQVAMMCLKGSFKINKVCHLYQYNKVVSYAHCENTFCSNIMPGLVFNTSIMNTCKDLCLMLIK